MFSPPFSPPLLGNYSRDLSTLGFSSSQRMKLKTAGFRTVNDLANCNAVALAREIGTTKEEALEILKIVKSSSTFSSDGISALDLLQMEDSRPYIVTFNADLDRMLGGGIPTHQITEFYGVPGIGKTQLGIQLSVDVQFPKVFDGCEGQCIYIGRHT